MFGAFARRLDYVSGDFGDDATYERVAEALGDASYPGLLPRDPAVAVRDGGRGAVEARAWLGAAGGWWSRSRSATIWRRPGSWRPSCTSTWTSRSSTGSTISSGKMGLEEILYLRFANTMLEPIWNRNYVALGADHDGGELRRRGPRALLRPGRRVARRRRQPPDAGGRGDRDGAAGEQATPTTLKDAKYDVFGRSPTPTPSTTSAASTTATASIDGVGRGLDTETYVALRLQVDNWRWAGVPFFLRTGKRLPVSADRGAPGVQPPAAAAVHLGAPPARREPNQIVIRIDPQYRRPDRARRAARRPAGRRRRSTST